jgi:sugar O-acyltransferase (sialic acid O-acetyltransferase NeuD family)
MKRLLIIGGGELGRQVAHWAMTTQRYEIVGFADDNLCTKQESQGGYPVLCKIGEVTGLYANGLFDETFIAIGYLYMPLRKELYQLMQEHNIPMATIISPQVYIDPTARIGSGVIIYPGSIVDKGAVIGDNTLINLGCIIAHDSTIGRHCFLSPNVTVAGFTEIGELCFLGCSSTILDSLKVTNGVTVGAGSLIRHDLTEPGTYIGQKKIESQ